MRRTVHGVDVHGNDVDADTRCAHYASERDVIALRFPCCGEYYPCFECHESVADHEADVWASGAAATNAILCGRCGTQLTIRTYLRSENRCPECTAGFNPGCRNHTHLYFSEELVQQVTQD